MGRVRTIHTPNATGVSLAQQLALGISFALLLVVIVGLL